MNQAHASQALQPGSVLQSSQASYAIQRVIGAGSFGITYLATSERDGAIRQFAIKEFFTDTCYRDDDGCTVRCTPTSLEEIRLSLTDFINEAKHLQKLCKHSHNIVRVDEVIEANGTAYYVMEYLNGGSPGKMPEKEAVKLVTEVAKAVREIHRERFLHLDIKPENIVIRTDEHGEAYPVLIDFGIAKHFNKNGQPTSQLQAKGASPGYAPQEQYAGIDEFSPKYDIYALGGVLLYLISGKNPPDAFKITPDQSQLAKLIPEGTSERVRRVILHAMRPNAFHRTPNIDVMLSELGAKQAVEGAEQPKAEAKKPARKASFSKVFLVVASCLFVAGMIALVAYLFFGPERIVSIPVGEEPELVAYEQSEPEPTPSPTADDEGWDDEFYVDEAQTSPAPHKPAPHKPAAPAEDLPISGATGTAEYSSAPRYEARPIITGLNGWTLAIEAKPLTSSKPGTITVYFTIGSDGSVTKIDKSRTACSGHAAKDSNLINNCYLDARKLKFKRKDADAAPEATTAAATYRFT